jgi:hypothetical protein
MKRARGVSHHKDPDFPLQARLQTPRSGEWGKASQCVVADLMVGETVGGGTGREGGDRNEGREGRCEAVGRKG